ncbi:hypothetical protein Q0M94_08985 [Deinococcus radiomollis]|uniref:hypothetical protein n=1 Tax=Deinococcus radiomollis TaxID=468916 RepID=UPI0038924FE3
MTELEGWLARQARELGLNALNVEDADPEVLRAYCAAVLNELAARGLLPGPEQIGCHAAARRTAN